MCFVVSMIRFCLSIIEYGLLFLVGKCWEVYGNVCCRYHIDYRLGNGSGDHSERSSRAVSGSISY